MAFAVVDLDGRVVVCSSKRNLGEEQLVAILSHYPIVLIASDTNPPSRLSRQMAAIFQARVYYPTHSLTWFEKARLSAGFQCENRHEKDALAAALKAYHYVENKMRQSARHARQKGIAPAFPVQLAVLQGKRMSEV